MIIPVFRFRHAEIDREILKALQLRHFAFEAHPAGTFFAGSNGCAVIDIVAEVTVRFGSIGGYVEPVVCFVLRIDIDRRAEPVVIVLFPDHKRELIVVRTDRTERSKIGRLFLSHRDDNRIGNVVRPDKLPFRLRKAELHGSELFGVHTGDVQLIIAEGIIPRAACGESEHVRVVRPDYLPVFFLKVHKKDITHEAVYRPVCDAEIGICLSAVGNLNPDNRLNIAVGRVCVQPTRGDFQPLFFKNHAAVCRKSLLRISRCRHAENADNQSQDNPETCNSFHYRSLLIFLYTDCIISASIQQGEFFREHTRLS